jgi:hypothetical protein
VILGKLTFGKDGLNFGLELCLARAGLKGYPVTVQTAAGCDILLVSLFWYRNVYQLAAFLADAGIKKGSGRPWILAGGMQATMTPEAVAGLVDWVFVGDADDHLAAVCEEIAASGTCSHPHVYRDGMPSVPSPAVCRPRGFHITTDGDDGGVIRCEIARGCKFKCAFCCLAGLKPYQEVPFAELGEHMMAARRKRCAFFAPERTVHSEWPAIKSEMARWQCHDMGQDARLEHLQEVDGASVTFGVEGLSERLRRTIGKPYTDDFILDRLGRFVDSRKNVARVSAYFIADLPGETAEDWAAVWALFERIHAADWSRRLVLCPVLNPLSPKPFTRLAGAPIDLLRDYGPAWRNLLRRDGGQWGFRIVETIVWGPFERTLDAIVQRAGSRAASIARAIPAKWLKTKPAVEERLSAAQHLLKIANRLGVSRDALECPPRLVQHGAAETP